MNLPPFVYVLKFWEALAFGVGGVLALLAFFGLIPAEWALTPGALLAVFLAVLKWFDIEPALRAMRWSAKAKKLLGK